MKTTKIYMFCISALLCAATNIYAQQGVAVSGGDATGVGGSVSYTIGQVDYITASGIGGTAGQGIQQPYEINVATGVQETGINLTCAVSPNPTADFVVLSIEKGELQGMSYSLFDVKGQMIAGGRLTTANTTISMVEYADALYLLKVFNNNTEIKSFKLIKNK